MFKTVLVTLMALLASSNAAPYWYESSNAAPYWSQYYSSYPYGASALAATYAAPTLPSAAYTAPTLLSAYTAPTLAAAPVAGAALPAAAYPAAVPYPLPSLSGYSYGVQELGPLVAPASAPMVVGSQYAYAAADNVYGRYLK